MPDTFLAGQKLTAAALQSILDGRGIVARSTFSATGSATSGTTESMDDAAGATVSWTADGVTTYAVFVIGRGLQGGTAGGRYSATLRDGGSGAPTAASTVYGSHNITKVITSTASDGVESYYLSATDVPSAGTHTVGISYKKLSAASATATPTGSAEIYVVALGVLPS
jgi:hypothetical protein